MVSHLLWLLAVLGAVFWIVLPAAVLVLAVVYKPKEAPELSDPVTAGPEQERPATG